MRPSARAENKCLDPQEQRDLAQYTLACETCKVDLPMAEMRLNECVTKRCELSFIQEPVVIGAVGVLAFVLGIVASSMGSK